MAADREWFPTLTTRRREMVARAPPDFSGWPMWRRVEWTSALHRHGTDDVEQASSRVARGFHRGEQAVCRTGAHSGRRASGYGLDSAQVPDAGVEAIRLLENATLDLERRTRLPVLIDERDLQSLLIEFQSG